jgi:hypothetical protein
MSTHSNPYSDSNPYAATSMEHSMQPGTGGENESIFRQGNLLVVHKRAAFPDRCLKSNEPTTSRLKRSLSWHHPAWFLLILVNLIVFIIVSMIIRKTAVLYIPLADRFKARRIKFMLLAWGCVLLGVLSLLAGFAMGNSDFSISLLILFPILLVTGALVGLFGCRVIYPKKIDDHFVWLGGVCQDFLNECPEFPYAR